MLGELKGGQVTKGARTREDLSYAVKSWGLDQAVGISTIHLSLFTIL